ncbi:MAG: hypothetical protein ACLQPD_18840 [Desulfomonilaceae bacterium]
MKTASTLLVAVCVGLVLAVSACMPSLQMSKPSSPEVSGSDAKNESSAESPTAAKPERPADAQLPPAPPDYKPPSLSEGLLEGPPDLSWKDEINASALEFGKSIPNVKHVKTCFSKLYGGWYLILYTEKAKKIGLEQYSWNAKSKEWEPSFQLKEIPAKELEYHLKGEVDDEKCFVLK